MIEVFQVHVFLSFAHSAILSIVWHWVPSHDYFKPDSVFFTITVNNFPKDIIYVRTIGILYLIVVNHGVMHDLILIQSN